MWGGYSDIWPGPKEVPRALDWINPGEGALKLLCISAEICQRCKSVELFLSFPSETYSESHLAYFIAVALSVVFRKMS